MAHPVLPPLTEASRTPLRSVVGLSPPLSTAEHTMPTCTSFAFGNTSRNDILPSDFPKRKTCETKVTSCFINNLNVFKNPMYYFFIVFDVFVK
jgi:hypothetical protein